MAGPGKEPNELKEAVVGISDILQENRQRFNFQEIITYDRYIIERFPTVAVFYESHTAETLSLGKERSKIKLVISTPIWIYLDNISPSFRTDEARDVMWDVEEIISQNVSLGGWCQRLEVLGGSVQPRVRANGVLGAARLSVVVEKLIWRARTSS